MSTPVMIGIMLGAAVILGFISVLQLQHKFKKAVVGHIFCTFITSSGSRYDELCKVSGNVVEAPAKAMSGAPKIKSYFIREDRRFDCLYPPSLPKFFQVSAPSALYYEGDREPIDPRKGHESPIGTPELWYNIQNEKFSSLMLRFGDEFQKLADILVKMPNLRVLYVLMGAAILVAVVSLVILMQVSGLLATLASLWGM